LGIGADLISEYLQAARVSNRQEPIAVGCFDVVNASTSG
jgi:hypothetical protein